MNNGMNRRDFMKYSIATGVLIAAGERLQGLASAEEAAKVTEVDKLTIWVLADNYYDTNIVEGKKHEALPRRPREVDPCRAWTVLLRRDRR